MSHGSMVHTYMQFHLCSQKKYVPIFMKPTHVQQHYIQISYQISPITDNRYRKHTQKLYSALKTSHVYKTRSYSLHILDIPSAEFLSKSDKTCRKEGNQLLGNTWLSVQIFTNQTAQRHYIECFYTAFHPKLDNKYQ